MHDHRHSPAGHRTLWNAEAKRYAQGATADFDSDPFLKIVRDAGGFSPESRVLDLGCGPGIYSTAVAPHVRGVVGVDISEEMIGYARERAALEGCGNCTFQTLNWEEADPAKLGMVRAFDTAIARLTPAVNTKADVDKFISCATGCAAYENFVNRRHRWMALAFSIAGDKAGVPWHDDMVLELIAYLRSRLTGAALFSREAQWGQAARPWETVADFCLRRLALRMTVSEELDRAVREEFKRQSCGGMLDTRENLTLLTVCGRPA